jgi:hypothetical protein
MKMNRRNFLQAGGIGAGLITMGLLSGKSNNLLARNNRIQNSEFRIQNFESFSLEILTDRPDTAISLVKDFIPTLRIKNVTFSQNLFPGEHQGDIAFVGDSGLINFREANDSISQQLHKISRKLNLPKRIVNPTLLTFRTDIKALKPEFINIFRDNIIINRIDINNNHNELVLPTQKGEMVLQIRNGSAKVISSSCKHKTCMNHGIINRAGQNIICIPNRIRVSIEGKNSYGIDGISY